MVKSCSAFKCTNRYSVDKSVSFHKFPADKNLKAQWIRAIRREHFNPTKHSVICGKHFKEADFLRKVPTNVLKSDAIPSVFDFPDHLKVKSPKHRRTETCRRTIIRHPLPASHKQKQLALALKQELQTDEGASTSGQGQGCSLATSPLDIEVKLEDSEIDIKDGIEHFSENISIKSEIDCYNLDSTDGFDVNAEGEFEATADNNLDINESATCSTSSPDSSFRSRINVIPQAHESNWLSLGTNAAEVNLPPVRRTRYAINYSETTRKSTSFEKRQKEKQVPDLCVLCAKDISKIRKKWSVANDSDIILLLTGINVLEYKIPLNSCPSCHKSLSALKEFQMQVCDASVLIKEKLGFHVETEFVSTDAIEEKHLVTAQTVECSTYIEPPVVDMREMHVQGSTVITDTDLDVSAMTVIDDTSEDSKFKPVVFKAIFPFSKCDACGRLYKDLINHKCQAGDVVLQSAAPTMPHLPVAEEKADKAEVSVLLEKKKSKRLCQICGKMYHKSSYREHLRSHVTSKTECKICRKPVRIYSLRFHMLRHQKTDKRVICSVCGKVYSQLSGLKKHEVVHGEKRHKCAICGQSFYYTKHLQRHLRSHSGEKPFGCSYCGKKFSVMWNLQQHERLHTNDKPYKCQVCSACFRHNVTLKHHLSSSHTAHEIAVCSRNSSVKHKTSKSVSKTDQNSENCDGDKCVLDSAATEKVDTSDKFSSEPETQ